MNTLARLQFRIGTSLVRASHSLSLSRDQKLTQWNRAVSRAEQIVGSPSNAFTWKVLNTDGGVGSAKLIRKLLNTSHPLMKTIKNLVHNGRSNLQTRGLIVLLLSRCAGHVKENPKLFQGEWEEATSNGVTDRQKNMAEIIEMIYASHLIHRDVVDVSSKLVKDKLLLDELQYGNKIAILVGDILISTASKKTAELNDCQVLNLVADAIGDFSKSEFVVRHDSFGIALPTGDMTPADWKKRTFFSNGSLLANACQASLIMAGHGEKPQMSVKEFGINLGFAWQLQYELQPFNDIMFQAPGVPFNLVSLPAVLYFQRNPQVLKSLEGSLDDLGRVDYADLFERILNSGCVDECNQHLDLYVDATIANLEGFDACYKAKEALIDVVAALK